MKRWTPAKSIGVVYSRSSGAILRIMNPVYEEELDLHPMTEDEFMLRPTKEEMGVSGLMDFDDVARVQKAMTP